jgi:hypothetical protein
MPKTIKKKTAKPQRGRTTPTTARPQELVKTQPIKQARRYVRIEISSPVSFVPFRLPLSGPVDREGVERGTILNISGGGVLLEAEGDFKPSDFLLLRIGLFENCHLENVLGRVKRVEACGDGKCLLGAEFLTRQMLEGLVADLPKGFLPDEIGAFDEKLRELLSRQIFAKRAGSPNGAAEK